MFSKVGIIGAGCYGTALAQCFSKKASSVLLVSDIEAVTSCINELHMNIKYLPGISLSANVSCTNTFSDVKNSDIIFMAVPMNAVTSVLGQIREHHISTAIVLCSKGLDADRGRLQSDIFEENLPNDYAILSGPSFAHEIANGLPAGVNIASKNYELSLKIAQLLSSQTFKLKAIDDYVGLQVAGALKNTLAVGCGILSGLKFGNSAIAKLIVGGMHEMAELSVVLGGKKDTFFELGGIGDTVLTCTSRQSRNILFGEYLASGGSLDNWSGPLAEGVFAAKAIPVFKEKYGIDLKIFMEIYKIIHNKDSLIGSISKIITD